MITRLFLIAIGFATVLAWPEVAEAQIHVQVGGGHNAPRSHNRSYTQNYNHYRRNQYQNYDHAVRDIVTSGVTYPYSSAGHLYRDQLQQQYNHNRVDQHRSYNRSVHGQRSNFNHYQRRSFGH